MPAFLVLVRGGRGRLPPPPTRAAVRDGPKPGAGGFVETDKGILISPQEVVAMDALETIGGNFKEEGLTLPI